jgi:hypothetical protein
VIAIPPVAVETPIEVTLELVAVSITSTMPRPTYAREPSGVIAIAAGPEASVIGSPTVVLVCVSITETLSDRALAA